MDEQDLIETRRVLEAYGASTVQSMREILIRADKDATGGLIRSLKYQITYDGQDLNIEFAMADYGQFVESGRRPNSKQPPISAITPWLRVKGIPLQFAFPIARSIGKKGIKPTPFFNSTIQATQNQLLLELQSAYTIDLTNYLNKQINTLNDNLNNNTP